MILLGAFLVALGWSLVGWIAARPLFGQAWLQRTNYRDATVPTAGGVVLVAATVLGTSVLVVAEVLGVAVDLEELRAAQLTLLAAVGFGLLGLFDDLAGVGTTSGYRGHLRSLARGEVTSGALKLLVGPALALVVVQPVAGDDVVRLVIDGALVALAANLANLFDRAPGRTLKVGVLAFVVLVAATAADQGLVGAAIVTGAAVGLLVPDLREELMLGDAGSNPLGAGLGLAVVLVCAPTTRTAVAVGLLLLNLASELVSFSTAIRRVRVLRFLDDVGRG